MQSWQRCILLPFSGCCVSKPVGRQRAGVTSCPVAVALRRSGKDLPGNGASGRERLFCNSALLIVPHLWTKRHTVFSMQRLRHADTYIFVTGSNLIPRSQAKRFFISAVLLVTQSCGATFLSTYAVTLPRWCHSAQLRTSERLGGLYAS